MKTLLTLLFIVLVSPIVGVMFIAGILCALCHRAWMRGYDTFTNWIDN